MSKEIDGLVVKLPAKKWNWQSSDCSKKVLFLSATVGIVRLWEWVHGLIDGLLFNQELKAYGIWPLLLVVCHLRTRCENMNFCIVISLKVWVGIAMHRSFVCS